MSTLYSWMPTFYSLNIIRTFPIPRRAVRHSQTASHDWHTHITVNVAPVLFLSCYTSRSFLILTIQKTRSPVRGRQTNGRITGDQSHAGSDPSQHRVEFTSEWVAKVANLAQVPTGNECAVIDASGRVPSSCLRRQQFT